MKKIFFAFTDWCVRNKRIIWIIFIALAVIRFLQLNYLNWDHGHLCTGYGGIQYGYDHLWYTGSAEKLVNNHPLDSISILYFGYISFIALFYKLGLGLEFALVFQLAFALLASYAIFDLCKLITGSRSAGFFAAGIYLINPFIIQWQLFIHTESLYSSMLVISSWLITRSYFQRSAKYYIPAVAVTVFTMFIRPSGLVILPAIITFILFFSKISHWQKTIILIGCSVITIVLISNGFAKNILSRYNFIEQNKKGIVIGEHPEAGQDKYFAYPISENKNSSIRNYSREGLFYFILGVKRISAGLFPIYRPYMSAESIIRFFIWMMPLYIFTIFGAVFIFKKNKGFSFLFLLLMFHIMLFIILFADREFRYLINFLPLFVILGSSGLYSSFQKLLQHSGYIKLSPQITD